MISRIVFDIAAVVGEPKDRLISAIYGLSKVVKRCIRIHVITMLKINL